MNVATFITGTESHVIITETNVLLEPTGTVLLVKLQDHANKATIKIMMDIVNLSLKLVCLLLFGMVKNVKLMETALQEHTIVEVAVKAMSLAKMDMFGIQFNSHVAVLQANNPMATVVSSVQEENNGFQELVAAVLQVTLI